MDVKTLVITVLPESEAKAVRVVFDLKGRVDETGEYPVYSYDGGRVAISCIINKGNTNAVTATNYLLDRYHPENAILVGTCAGRPDKTKIGDVIFSQLGVLDYGQSSLIPGEELRFESVGAPDVLAKNFSFLKSDPELEEKWWPLASQAAKKFKAGFPEAVEPRLWGKTIASGNQIINERSMKVLTDANAYIYAADQDSAGFAASCKAKHVDWVAVRGVSDCGDRDTRKGCAEYATVTAAAMVKLFLDSGAETARKSRAAEPDSGDSVKIPPSLGCTHIWVPVRGREDEENERRNRVKYAAMEASEGTTIRLLAQTGQAFLYPRGTFYKSVRRHLEHSGELRVVLMDPSVKNVMCTEKESEAISWKCRQALEGCSGLREEFGPRISLRIVPINLPATIFLTNKLCFYEPYVHITERRERLLFVAFEMLFDSAKSAHGYNLMMEYFQELYDKGADYFKGESRR